MDRLEQQLVELKNLILSRSKRRSQQRSGSHNTVDGELESEDDASRTTRTSSRELSRDFGGRKLQIPIFRGDDAYGWIVRAERYFKLNLVYEDEKLDAVLIALVNKALSWYQWWTEQNPEPNWEEFKGVLIRRFQPGLVQNLFGQLLSLQQTSSIMRYREKFEREFALLKKEKRIMLKGIFLNGLKEEIQAELKLFRTESLEELMDRALLLEEKNAAMRKVGLMNSEKKLMEKTAGRHTRSFTRWERGGNKEGTSSKMNEADPRERKPLSEGKLSHAKLREQSRKGLCFKCGETWDHDHVCKLKHYQFVLIEGSQEEASRSSEEEEDKVEPMTNKVLQISLKGKEGLTSNRSFKVEGMIRRKKVLILVDCGASANFISKELVKQLNLNVHDTRLCGGSRKWRQNEG